jgi:hypothetical protein
LNRFKTELNRARHCVARARLLPPCCRAASLTPLPPAPPADTGPSTHPVPTCQPRPHHIGRAPSPFPIRQPASAVSARCCLRPRHLEPSRPHGPRCRAAPWALSLPFFFLHAAPSPPPPFPSLVLPRTPTDLEKTPVPHSARFRVHTRARAPPFSTAYASASLTPATRDPSSSLVPI